MWLRFQRVVALRIRTRAISPPRARLRIARRLVLRIEGVGVSLAPGLEPAPANGSAFEAIYRGAIVSA